MNTTKERTHMNTQTRQDYDSLKAALLNMGSAKYEQIRVRLIAELGYDQFRTLQNEVFKEIGTIKFEETPEELQRQEGFQKHGL